MTTETPATTDDDTPATTGSEPRKPLVAKGSGSSGRSASASGRSSSIAPRRAPAPPSRPTTPGGGGPAAPPRHRLPWILAAVGLVGTLAFGGLWWTGRDDSAASASGASTEGAPVQDAAEAFSKALTNFDGSSIDADFDRIVALATGDFRNEVDTFFSADTRKQLKEAQASSRGEVRSAYVQGVDGDRASAFVVLDQTIANNKSPQPKADTLRMELALRLVKGRWLVAQVNVLQAPSGGSTLPGAVTTTTAPKGATPGG